MLAFELNDLREKADSGDQRYLEFLRVSDLSVGLYQLAAGEADPQNPHLEDEVYYVISGRAKIQVGKEMRPVQAGSIVYVAADVPHKFLDIQEDLQLLVFFAPAETH